MSEQRNNKRKPTHRVSIPDERGDETFWTEVGAAWDHGNVINVELRPGLSVSGKVCLFPAKEKADGA